MKEISVNISGNKLFKNSAEEILTTCPQFIHHILTDLSTACEKHLTAIKAHRARAEVVRQHDTLCRAVILGYRAGVEGQTPPNGPNAPANPEPQIQYLATPFCTLGYQIACKQIEQMLAKGHHRAITSHRPDAPRTGE